MKIFCFFGSFTFFFFWKCFIEIHIWKRIAVVKVFASLTSSVLCQPCFYVSSLFGKLAADMKSILVTSRSSFACTFFTILNVF